MKICTISDIHGRVIWKEFADIKFLLTATEETVSDGNFVPQYFKYVFIGDFVDSFTLSNEVIEKNLLEIIRFKKLYPEYVELLWGNHDVNYFVNKPWNKMEGYVSGYRAEAHHNLFEIFDKNKELFKVAYQKNNHIFSHAGIHFGWYHFIFTKAIKEYPEFKNMSIAEQLNTAFDYNIKCLHDIDLYRGGHQKQGGPFWCSKDLLWNKPLKYTHQYVGHTPLDNVVVRKINESTTITFIDVLHKKKAFYTVII